MIIIIAEPGDLHALIVAKRLFDRGESSCILSSSDYPQQVGITWKVNGQPPHFTITYAGHIIRSDDVKGVWLRRLKPCTVAQEVVDKQVHGFVYNECRDFFLSWLCSVKNIVNRHQAEAQALLKMWQLEVAKGVGLEIPSTLVSNDAEEIAEFYRTRKSDLIFKSLTPTAFQFTGTQIMSDEHLQNVAAVALAPCIFQERIAVRENLRITLVDEEVFAVRIKTSKPQAQVDWRLDFASRIEATTLPDHVVDRLLAMNRRLGLRYGAVDMILDQSGRYVFLENNPGGQFLFAEIHSGLPISAAIAKALARVA